MKKISYMLFGFYSILLFSFMIYKKKKSIALLTVHGFLLHLFIYIYIYIYIYI